MSYKLAVETKARCLHVRVTGENTPGNVRAYLREVYQACADSGIPAVLVEEDLRGLALDPVDVYQIIAESSARTAPVIQMIAYVDLNPKRSEANMTLGEAVARDRGLVDHECEERRNETSTPRPSHSGFRPWQIHSATHTETQGVVGDRRRV